MRDRVEPLLRADTNAIRVEELAGLSRAAGSFAGQAGLAGFEDLAQISSALEALLRELLDKPSELTPSALRTIVDACDFVAVLSGPTDGPKPQSAGPFMVLVVDDDAICRKAVCLALGRLNVSTLSVDDPLVALRLLAENRFSLIVLDVEMPRMNGFKLCKELRTLPANRQTPLVFVTTLSGFESREQAIESGGNDLLAKPFLPMELAVKALSLFRQGDAVPRS